jgi:hypothetical protein
MAAQQVFGTYRILVMIAHGDCLMFQETLLVILPLVSITSGNPTTLSDYLISPVLNFSGYQTAQLSFQYAYSPYYSNPDFYSDSLIISISTNCGNSWTRILAKGDNGTGNFATVPVSSFSTAKMFVPSKAADWCGGGVGPACYTVNLNSFVGLK